jgi:hypothetical protein
VAEAEAEPEPEPEPEPEAEPPPPPSPAQILVEAVRTELRHVRRGNEEILVDGLLDAIAVGEARTRALAYRDDGKILINARHPVAKTALREPTGVELSLIASAVYTALNLWLEDVTDTHEALFHRLHADLHVPN